MAYGKSLGGVALPRGNWEESQKTTVIQRTRGRPKNDFV